MISENIGFNLGTFAERKGCAYREKDIINSCTNRSLSEKLGLLKKEISYWNKRDWVHLFFAVTVPAVTLSTAAFGVVDASSKDQTKRFTLPNGECSAPLAIKDLRRSKNGPLMKQLVDMAVPLQVYVIDRWYFNEAVTLQNALKGDVRVKSAIPTITTTEGTFQPDESGICRLVIYYP